jgi:3-deoxy-D-manno-octulosonate 8-phosphate phosphatase (KDO 8-P phosphatase)
MVTGRASAAVERRAAELKIDVLEMACSGKADALRDIAQKQGLDLAEIAFIGDDWNDLPAMDIAGIAAAPADSPYDIRRHADFVASARGGHGAVREFIEWLLDAQTGWTNAAERYAAALGRGELEIRQ